MKTEQQAKEFQDLYYANRECCPSCGCPVSRDKHHPVEVAETGYDGNRATCANSDCRGGIDQKGPWEGVIHELISPAQGKKLRNELALASET